MLPSSRFAMLLAAFEVGRGQAAGRAVERGDHLGATRGLLETYRKLAPEAQDLSRWTALLLTTSALKQARDGSADGESATIREAGVLLARYRAVGQARADASRGSVPQSNAAFRTAFGPADRGA